MIPVLCINDSDINLFLQKKLLLQSGITDKVITAHNGQEALNYYSKLKEIEYDSYPKLILLDIHMPIVSGWEFLDKFSELYLPLFPDTLVIINSSTVDSEEIEKANKYPFVIDFLNRPLTLEYLRKIDLSAVKE